MPDYDCDPYGETQSAPEPPGATEATSAVDPFDAFRARRAQERAEQEPFPDLAAPTYEQYTQVAAPVAFDESAERPPHRRLRSAIVFGGVVALATAIGAGVWAFTNSSGGASAAASAGTTPSSSAPASPGSEAAKAGKAVNARITVTTVGSDSFTGTTARGETVVVHITATTRFGTAARPFTRAQLVPGATIVTRLRKDADGSLVAAVIASEIAKPNDQPTATASSDAGA